MIPELSLRTAVSGRSASGRGMGPIVGGEGERGFTIFRLICFAARRSLSLPFLGYVGLLVGWVTVLFVIFNYKILIISLSIDLSINLKWVYQFYEIGLVDFLISKQCHFLFPDLMISEYFYIFVYPN